MRQITYIITFFVGALFLQSCEPEALPVQNNSEINPGPIVGDDSGNEDVPIDDEKDG